MTTWFDQYQQELLDREWTWDDVPFYHGNQRQSSVELHHVDYLDVYPRIYGRQIGACGIGRLREVAVIESGDQGSIGEWSGTSDEPGGARKAQVSTMIELLRSLSIEVCLVNLPEMALAIAQFAELPTSANVIVATGGAIVPQVGCCTEALGRGESLSRWLLWNLNIPTLLTVYGEGVCEAGALVWLADDVCLIADSSASNSVGRSQVHTVLALTSGTKDLVCHIVQCQGTERFNTTSGASSHLTTLITPLDVGTVLCHPPAIDAGTLMWLEEHEFKVIEADFGEQAMASVCNSLLVEPGVIVMPEEAPRTIAKVRSAGIEVIEAPYSGFQGMGWGLKDAVLEIYREPGPTRFA